ncbi:MAG: hypothetical protein AAF333_09660 [Planctomycetota bacterium]
MKDIQKSHQETLQLIQTALKVLKWFADLMSYPALLLLRRNLGERTLSGLACLVAWFIVSLVAVSCGLSPAYWLTLILPAMYAVHSMTIRLRKKRGIRHYSLCRGDSWFDWVLPRQPHLNRGVLEPAVLVCAALFILSRGDRFVLPPEVTGVKNAPFGPWAFSLYLAAMGLGLFFVEARLRQQERNTLLDHIDQQIIGTYFSSELNEQKEVADEGFAVAELAGWNPRQKHQLVAHLGLPMFRRQPQDGDGDQPDSLWSKLLDPLPTSAPGTTPGTAPGTAPGIASGTTAPISGG